VSINTCSRHLDIKDVKQGKTASVSDEMFQKNSKHTMTTEDEVMTTIGVTRGIVQKIMEKKLNLFSHMCTMTDDRLLKKALFE